MGIARPHVPTELQLAFNQRLEQIGFRRKMTVKSPTGHPCCLGQRIHAGGREAARLDQLAAGFEQFLTFSLFVTGWIAHGKPRF